MKWPSWMVHGWKESIGNIRSELNSSLYGAEQWCRFLNSDGDMNSTEEQILWDYSVMKSETMKLHNLISNIKS